MGRGIWPGVALGEICCALLDGLPWTVACGTAMGCTLQALFGAELALRWGVRPSLERLRDVFGFIVSVVMLSTLVSPTIGLISLYLGGHFDSGDFGLKWWTWWLSDLMGVLVVTPVLLTWCYPVLRQLNIPSDTATEESFTDWRLWSRNKRQIIWAVVCVIVLVAVSWAVFGSKPDEAMLLPIHWTALGVTNTHAYAHYPLEYLPLPFVVVIWAALQFGQRGAVLGTLLVSSIAIWGTSLGRGPFFTEGHDLSRAILLLQSFVSLEAVTALVLAATVTERAVVVKDITEHQQAEEALARENEELEKRVEERTAALKELNQQLLREISEHKRVEEALRESERRFRAIFDGSFQFIGLLSPDGTVLEANQTVLNFAGVQASAVVGRPLWETPGWAISPETQEQLKKTIAKAATGEFVRYEVDLTGAGDTVVTIDFSLKPFKDETGQVVLLIPEGRDITQRKQAEAARRSSEQRFRQLAENIHEVFWMSSLDSSEILYVSPAYEKIWGRTCESLYQDPLSWVDTIHPQDRQRAIAAFHKQSQEDYHQEYRIVRPDGSIRWIRDRVFPIRDEQGRVYRFAGIAEDITDRKQATSQLHRQTQQRQLFAEITLKIRQSLQLEAILQTTVTEVQRILQVDRVLIFELMFDGSGIVVTETVAPEWPAIAGQKIDDPCFAQLYLEEYRQGRICAVDDLLQAQVKACHVEMLQQFGVRANLVVPILQRETLWGLLIAHQCNAPRQWQNFEIELLRQLADQVGIALAQSQLLENETTTKQQLAQQNLYLEQARLEAEAANRAKSEFLANMSHELRTPLHGILGYAQILQRESNLTPNQQHGLEIIERSGEHLLTLLNDILDLSKIEAQKMEISLSDFQFPRFLDSIIEIVRIRAEQKNISFSYQRLSQLPCCVRGDERRLRQVLINLLGNAIKFTDKGGVTFKVGYVGCQELLAQRDEAQVEQGLQGSSRLQVESWENNLQHSNLPLRGTLPFGNPFGEREQHSNLPLHGTLPFGNPFGEREQHSTQKQPAQKMRFVVEDTGIGMSAEQLTEIFLPFHQSGETHLWVEGTGLGLTISQRLVQLMGGSLNVESTLGQGSVFWLDLDLPEVSKCLGIKEDNESAIAGFRGNKRKVLVADDKQENRSILVNLLSPLGFEVIEAADGQDCLNQALKRKPDAILLDPVLPKIDGLEVTRQLRRSPDLKDVVVLATSASVFDYNQQECLAAGCNSFIPQPVRTENLFEELKLHLGLEWFSEGESGVDILPTTSLPPFVPPPPSEIAALYELAMMGDIRGISEKAKKLEQLDEQFVPFAKQLGQLAKNFQEKQILELVKKYMVGKE
jgi:PAS domain S-box-containing protein